LKGSVVSLYFSGNFIHQLIDTLNTRDNSTTNILGKNIQRVRQEKKMTQDELSRKADVPYTTLTKIEIGFIKASSVFVVSKIANTLGMAIESLIIDNSKDTK
jgi:DNA-binding XRE family transcriptional regulator